MAVLYVMRGEGNLGERVAEWYSENTGVHPVTNSILRAAVKKAGHACMYRAILNGCK